MCTSKKFTRSLAVLLSLALVLTVFVSLGSGVSYAASAWAPYTSYNAGVLVTYNSVTYKCVQGHTSLPGWEPPYVPALWQKYDGVVPTVAPTKQNTATPTKINTPTPTKKVTATPTKSYTPTATKKATATPTKSYTPTATKKATATPTKNYTPTPTKKVTATPTKGYTPTPTSAAANIRLSFSKSTVAVGETFTATLNINSINYFSGYQVNIKYDSTKLQPIDPATGYAYDNSTDPASGTLLTKTTYSPFTTSAHNLSSGILNFSKAYLKIDSYRAAGVPETTGSVAVITFKALQPGSTTVLFQNANTIPNAVNGTVLFDWYGSQITSGYSVIQQGPITIN